jgi:hypothetical protein
VGIDTGLVVVGEMGRERHEQLALAIRRTWLPASRPRAASCVVISERTIAWSRAISTWMPSHPLKGFERYAIFAVTAELAWPPSSGWR